MNERSENNRDGKQSRAFESPSQDEIERVLDKEVAAILAEAENLQAKPGWSLIPLMKAETEYKDGDHAIPIPAITEDKAEQLVQMAQKDPLAFDLASHIAGWRIVADMELPVPLRNFAADVLTKEVNRPSQKGRPRSKNALLEIYQYHLCQYLRFTVPMEITRDPGKKTFTACDAVAQAFSRAGKNTTYAQMASLCYDAGYSERRELVKFLGLLNF